MNDANDKSKQNTDIVSKETIFKILAQEAGGFYQIITVTASSFLGGTLLFMDRIAPKPQAYSLCFLFIGWILLIVSISSVAYVRRYNLKSAQYALQREFNKAKELDCKKDMASNIALISLVLGMACIMVFGSINIVNGRQLKEEVGVNENKNEKKQQVPKEIKLPRTHSDSPKGSEKKNIPFGELGGGSDKKDDSGKK